MFSRESSPGISLEFYNKQLSSISLGKTAIPRTNEKPKVMQKFEG